MLRHAATVAKKQHENMVKAELAHAARDTQAFALTIMAKKKKKSTINATF